MRRKKDACGNPHAILLREWREKEEKKVKDMIISKKKVSNRKCLRCGKDPSPNYFYCKSCHPSVSDKMDKAGFIGRTY